MTSTRIKRSFEGWSLRRMKPSVFAFSFWELPEREARATVNRLLVGGWAALPADRSALVLERALVCRDEALVRFKTEDLFCPVFPEVWDGVQVTLTDSQAEILVALGWYSALPDVASSLGFGCLEDFVWEVEYGLRMLVLRSVRAEVRRLVVAFRSLER